MWSEEWDKKFRDAAAQDASTARQDQGWNQMEQLLEQHLPVKKRRKRLFILFFLLGGMGLAVYLSSTPFSKPEITDTNKPGLSIGSPTLPENKTTNSTTSSVPIDIVSNDIINKDNSVSSINKPSIQKTEIADNFPRQQLPVKRKNSISETDTSRDIENPNRAEEVSARSVEKVEEIFSTTTAEQNQSEPATLDTTLAIENKTDSSILQDSVSTELAKKPQVKTHKWGFSLLAGADISGTGINNPGEWRGAFGVGISYDINPNWTIRTGFLVNRKVYGADSNDYNPPKVFWNYVSELESVDANCLVFEIPLNVLHYFKSNGQGRWFASAGLSTFLMKKETYHYDYKDLSGQPAYMSRTYNNYSNHAFSILQLSGGYQFKVGKNLVLGAEPYFKLPLGGVGYGKVKLQSAGMLFSATIKR